MDLEYGKKITTESFFRGNLKSVRTEYEKPVMVLDKTAALIEIMNGLELILKKRTAKIHFIVEADPRTFNFKSVTMIHTEESESANSPRDVL